MMFVSDYVPTKRVGVEELQGCILLLEQRMEAREADGKSESVEQFRDEGVWLALNLMATGKFKYPADFLAVFDNNCKEVFE